MNMACAVRRHVIAQSVEILAAAFYEAFHGAFEAGQDFEEFARGFDRGIDQSFRAQGDAMRFLQEAKRKAREDAESILAVNATSGKRDGNGLVCAAAFR